MINNLSSKCQHCMYLIRILVLNGLKFNQRISVKYIRLRDNILSDSLSRLNMKCFRKFGPEMNQVPDKVDKTVESAVKLYKMVL